MEHFGAWNPANDETEERIEFHSEDVDFELPDENRIRHWIETTIQAEGKNLQTITCIFCSDAYLLDLNLEYLHHDTLTDIITFQYSKLPDVEGDIFISIERVRENALTYEVRFEEELRRVIIHGVFHLCGYSDKTPEDKAQMTQKENEALRNLDAGCQIPEARF
jgi:rRNA maturation RNase YbeY